MMNKSSIKKWIAFWLAMALMLPVTALGESDAAVAVERACAEEMVTEASGDLIPELFLNEALTDGAGEILALPDDEADEAGGSEQGVDPEQTSAAEETPSPEVTPEPGETSEPGETIEPGETSEPEETTPVKLAESSINLGLKEKGQLTLEGGLSPESVGAVFTSSNSSVVAVNKSTGAITGKKKGSATVTMRIANGDVSTCAVKVKSAPSKIKLSSTKLTLGVGEERTLKATLSSGSASAITFSSSNKKVVKVDGSGRITALKKGTANITAKTFNGKKSVCKVTVRKAPSSVSLGKKTITLWEGDSYTASVKLTANSSGKYVLTSDDETVVAVSGNGLKGVGVGTATVTVTTYNGLTDSMSVEIRRRPVYRALLVGECTFPGTRYIDLPAKKDVSLMKSMLDSALGPTGSEWSVATRTNRTSAQIHEDIQTVFAGAQEGDVSLFYISTHGDQEVSFDGEYPEYAGYLVTYPDRNVDNYYDQRALTMPRLASWLKEVPGQVIVILDSCGSGAAIYGATGNAAQSGSDATFAPGPFDGAVVNAFAAEDIDVVVQETNEGAFVVKNKFYVLTAAAYQEMCWTCDGKYSYFTKWLTEGIGTKGRMPADTNKNKQTTLKELYTYIKKRGDSTKITDSKGTKYKQHVQVYPANSGFELFYRK